MWLPREAHPATLALLVTTALPLDFRRPRRHAALAATARWGRPVALLVAQGHLLVPKPCRARAVPLERTAPQVPRDVRRAHLGPTRRLRECLRAPIALLVSSAHLLAWLYPPCALPAILALLLHRRAQFAWLARSSPAREPLRVPTAVQATTVQLWASPQSRENARAALTRARVQPLAVTVRPDASRPI